MSINRHQTKAHKYNNFSFQLKRGSTTHRSEYKYLVCHVLIQYSRTAQWRFGRTDIYFLVIYLNVQIM